MLDKKEKKKKRNHSKVFTVHGMTVWGAEGSESMPSPALSAPDGLACPGPAPWGELSEWRNNAAWYWVWASLGAKRLLNLKWTFSPFVLKFSLHQLNQFSRQGPMSSVPTVVTREASRGHLGFSSGKPEGSSGRGAASQLAFVLRSSTGGCAVGSRFWLLLFRSLEAEVRAVGI